MVFNATFDDCPNHAKFHSRSLSCLTSFGSCQAINRIFNSRFQICSDDTVAIGLKYGLPGDKDRTVLISFFDLPGCFESRIAPVQAVKTIER